MHEVAERLGLSHQSEGSGRKRRVIILFPTDKVLQSAAAPPRVEHSEGHRLGKSGADQAVASEGQGMSNASLKELHQQRMQRAQAQGRLNCS